MMSQDGHVRNVVQTTKNGEVVVQFRRLLKDGKILGADGTVIHSGRIENFASNIPGSFDKMQTAMMTALEVTAEEYDACARAANSRQHE